ncbi:MAG: glycosyltransferase family 9 protein [Pseudomonadota bacterium]
MNILIIRTHRFGDILQLTPMLRGLRERYPESKISFLVGRDFVQLLEGNPDVNEIIPISEKEYRYWLRNSPEKYPRIFNEIYDLVCELKRKDFEIVVNRQYEWGAILAHLIGAETILGGSYSPERGFYFEDRTSRDLFDLIRNNRRANRRNLVDWACSIAGAACHEHRQMFFPTSRRAREQVKAFLGSGAGQEEKSLVAVQMGAGKSFRQWESENFAEIVYWLVREKGKKVVLIGSEKEKYLAESIERSLVHETSRLINLVGKTSLQTLGAVLEECEYLITGDTGPMHLAAAVGTSVMALFFGTAYPWETAPYGVGHFILYSDLPCSPCFDPGECKEGHRCKKEIKPRVVMKAIEAAEAFWGDEVLDWESGSHSAKLFVTAQGEQGEQVLLSARDETHFPSGKPQRRRYGNRTELPQRESLLIKGEQVIQAFLRGEADRGFSSFADYFDAWLVSKETVINGDLEMQRAFSHLLGECLPAMENRDVVTLIDTIEYGFKPLIERSLFQNHDLEMGRSYPEGFS